MTAFHYTLAGKPTTWKRTALYAGRRITNGAQRKAQRAHQLAALAARPRDWRRDGRFSVDVSLDVGDMRRADVDNLVKLILDALNGVCWEDDSQIDALHVTRALCGDAGPRTVVRVTRVGERMARRAA